MITDRSINLDDTYARIATRRGSAPARPAAVPRSPGFVRWLRILLTACLAALGPLIGLVLPVERDGSRSADRAYAHAGCGVAGRSGRARQAARVSRALWRRTCRRRGLRRAGRGSRPPIRAAPRW